MSAVTKLFLVCSCYKFSLASKVHVVPSSGIVLERLNDVSLPSTSWTFVVNYDLKVFSIEMLRLESLEDDLSNFFRRHHFLTHYFEKQYDKFNASLTSYLNIAKDVLSLLPKNESMQEVASFGFIENLKIANNVNFSLFSSSLDEDNKEITSIIDKLDETDDKIQYDIKTRLTLIKFMEQKIETASKNIVKLTDSLVISTELLKSNYYLSSDNITHKNFLINRTSDFYNKLEFSLSEATFQLVRLKSVIYSASGGKLSADLIEPKMFTGILKNMSSTYRSFYFPAYHNLSGYSLSVSCAASSSSLMFLITLPVFTESSTFSVFRPHSYPVFDSVIGSWIGLDLEPSVLLLSLDQLFYTVITESDYRNCGSTTMCRDVLNVRSRNDSHCLLNVFFNSTVQCNFVLKKLHKHYVEKVQDKLIFSTNSNQTLLLYCPNTNSTPVRILGHGIINDISSCTLNSTNQTVPSRINLTITSTLVVPSLNWTFLSLLNHNRHLIRDLTLTKTKLRQMQTETGDVKAGALISAMKQLHERTDRETYDTIVFTVCGILALVIVLWAIKCLLIFLFKNKYESISVTP